MIDLTFEPARSALVIVDMQVGYTDPDNVRGAWMRQQDPERHRYFFDRVAQAEGNLTRLLAHFRDLRQPVIHVTFGWSTPDRSDLTLPAHRGRPEWAGPETFLPEDARAAFTPASHEETLADFRWLYGAVVTTSDLIGSGSG